jgi:PAS domain-containing protein
LRKANEQLQIELLERKRAEEGLRASQANLAAAQRVAHIGSWELSLVNLDNLTENPLRWSDELFRIFGYQPGQIEVSNETFFHAVHPDDRNAVRAAVAEAIKERKRTALNIASCFLTARNASSSNMRTFSTMNKQGIP